MVYGGKELITVLIFNKREGVAELTYKIVILIEYVFEPAKCVLSFFSSVRLLVRFKSSQGKSPFVHFSTQIKYNCHMTHIFDPVYVQFIPSVFSVNMH